MATESIEDYVAGLNAAGKAVLRAALSAGGAPPYPSGQFFTPDHVLFASGGVSVADSMRMLPFRPRRPFVLAGAGVRVTSAAGGGNMQFAIYAAHATSNAPTGGPIWSSSSQAPTSIGSLEVTGLSVAMDDPLYWLATNADATGAGASFGLASATSGGVPTLTGASTAGGIIGNGSTAFALTKSQTFGTWPTLTGSLSADSISGIASGAVPVLALKAA